MEPEDNARRHQPQQEDTPLSVPRGKPDGASEGQEGPNGDKCASSEKLPPATQKPAFISPENFFEAVIAVTAVVGLIFLGQQSCVLRESVDEARKATIAATNATLTAQAQTNILSEQVFRGERAYLLVKNIRLEGHSGPLDEGNRLRLMWDTVNVGHTPAHNLRTSMAVWFGERAEEPIQDIVEGYSEARVLGPSDIEESPDMAGVWLDSTPGRIISPDEMARLMRGEIVLNARITVRYDTVFKDVVGVTRACAYYEGSRFSYCGLRGTSIE